MATLKDIAKMSGVSLGTTSAVFNNKPWVSADIRKRVLAIAKELNYEPNQAARALKTKTTNTIGLIVSDITNPFFPEIIRSIEERVRASDYGVILGDSNKNTSIGMRCFNLLVGKQVDGIVLVGDIVPADELFSFLKNREFPIAVIEKEYGHPLLNTFIVDKAQGAFMATTHLLELDYWPVGFISGSFDTLHKQHSLYSKISRLQGYKSALQAKGISFDRTLVVEGDFRFQGGYQAMIQFLDRPEPPRAIFAANDLMAIGAMEAAKEKGLNIPEDIAFVGYDDIPEASYCSPPLTTVALPKNQLGILAAESLLDIISKKENKYQRKILPPGKLIVRKSSKLA